MSQDIKDELERAKRLAAKAEGKVDEQTPLGAADRGIRFYTGSLLTQAYALDVGEEMAVILKSREARTAATTPFAPGQRHPFLKEFTFETSVYTAINTQTEAVRYVMIVKRTK